jgi:hypothetical protein
LIPVEVLCGIVAALVLGEIACGTSPYFAAMVAIIMLSIGITYNLLGGLGTMSGWLFANFAIHNIVISQFAKVLFWEPADSLLPVPQLTISVYAVFYASALLGFFLYGQTRFKLPRPIMPAKLIQVRTMYWIAVVVGSAATLLFEINNATYGTDNSRNYNTAHSVGQAFMPLLIFSLVLAVELRLRETQGKHSIDLRVMISAVFYMFFSFADSVRSGVIIPIIVYIFVCFFRKYRFSARHYITIAAAAVIFAVFYSPLALMTRDLIWDMKLSDRIAVAFNTLEAHHDLAELTAYAKGLNEGNSWNYREQYYNNPNTVVLNRLSLIRADANVIEACAKGYHYGFSGVAIDIHRMLPRFLFSDKQDDSNSMDYVGRITGMSNDVEGNTFPQITAISDCFGAFGWIGPIVFPMIILPLTLATIESFFKFDDPWGLAAFGSMFFLFGELVMSRCISIAVRNAIVLVALSYVVVWISRLITPPSAGDELWIIDEDVEPQSSADAV